MMKLKKRLICVHYKKIFILVFIMVGSPTHGDVLFSTISSYVAREELDIRGPLNVCLATVSSDGQPHSRMMQVIFNENGIYFTSYESTRKVNALLQNPRASLLLFLPKINAQIELLGRAVELDREKSLAHWQRLSLNHQARFVAFDIFSRKEQQDQQVFSTLVNALMSQHTNDTIPLPKSFLVFSFITEKGIFYASQRQGKLAERFALFATDMGWERSVIEP